MGMALFASSTPFLPKKRQLSRNSNPGVYFMDGGDLIKIGFSRSLETRMIKMGTDLPGGVKLLLVQPGTFRTEKVLHRHFADCRHRGEWFHKTPELLAYIEERKKL